MSLIKALVNKCSVGESSADLQREECVNPHESAEAEDKHICTKGLLQIPT